MTSFKRALARAVLALPLPGQVPSYTILTIAGTTPPGDGGLASNAALGAGLGKVIADSAGMAPGTSPQKSKT